MCSKLLRFAHILVIWQANNHSRTWTMCGNFDNNGHCLDYDLQYQWMHQQVQHAISLVSRSRMSLGKLLYLLDR